MEQYAISSRSYQARAELRLASGTPVDLHYAALELRCGVEARLREHLEPHEWISVGRRSDWRVGNLHRTAEEAFRLGDRVARLVISEGEREIATLYYTPVSARLKVIAERLGSYLHAPKRFYAANESYWSEFRKLVEEGIELLRESNFGTLLGPLMLTPSGSSRLPMEFVSDSNGVTDDSLRHLKGKRLSLNVAYFDTLEDARRKES